MSTYNLINVLEQFNILDDVRKGVVQLYGEAAWNIFYKQTLTKWTFKWNARAMRRLGCVKPRYKVMEISPHIMNDKSRLICTIKHETAHIIHITFHPDDRQVHGRLWQRAMLALGETPSRTSEATEQLQKAQEQNAKVKITCRDCGAEHFYLRKPKIERIKRCVHVPCENKPNGGRFDIKFLK